MNTFQLTSHRYRCCSDTDATVELRELTYDTTAKCLSPIGTVFDLQTYGLDEAYFNPIQLLDEGESQTSGESLDWYSPLNQDDAFGDNGYMEEEYTEGEPFTDATPVTEAPTGQLFPILIMDDDESSSSSSEWSDWASLN